MLAWQPPTVAKLETIGCAGRVTEEIITVEVVGGVEPGSGPPVQLSAMVSTLVAAFVVTFTVAEIPPSATGEQATFQVQEMPTANVPPHVLPVSGKCVLSELAMPEMVKLAVPLLVSEKLWVGLEPPIVTVPKLKETGLRATAGAGVEVASG